MPAHKTKVQKTKKLNKPFLNKSLIFALATFILGFFTHLLVSVILASNNDDQIHACVNKRNGETRIITDYQAYKDGKKENERKDNKVDKNGCRENEISLSWNKEGPPGSPGGSGGGSSANLLVCPECNIDSAAGNRLAGRDLSNSILLLSTFNGSNLAGANLSHANLERAAFMDADLSNVNFEGANLKGAVFTNAKLDGVKWNNTTCPDGTNSNDHNNTCEGHFLAE